MRLAAGMRHGLLEGSVSGQLCVFNLQFELDLETVMAVMNAQ